MTTLTRVEDAGPAVRPAPSPPRPSSILLKALLAISGLVMFGYVFIHMVGNLKVYLGAQALDAYAAWLRDFGYPLLPHEGLLWVVRVVLLIAVVVHMAAAVVLARRNRAATGAARRRPASSYTARTMPVTGIAILLFIIFHILDLTTGQANPDFAAGAVHANVIASMSRWPVALTYVGAVLLLGAHLMHGLWSAFTTLGVLGPRLRSISRGTAVGLAGAVVLGNASIPLAVALGAVQ